MNESELLALCREGDHRAFAELSGHCKQVMWSVALQITGNHEDAQDAIQEALTSAWQNLHRFRGESGFRTWMYAITRNAAMQIVRRRKDVLQDTDLADDEIVLIDQAPLTADRVVDADAVRWALGQLSDVFREALVLREYADLSYAEIAEAQGTSVQTVRSRINRARNKVVELLAPSQLL
ncbi:sigma-70 family RNA polymerase sigma factor [Rhodococcus sp. D2-41]|uniref:Sigma-70 family RNA polymerase sigma factor n=1 Tax=Speluncibacter jeojiensis TaxID=2710754 RepID=A0A9X4REM8_9ACTN|nr:sigma-70 family RNA polymerase sigma factor [Rhodococcus sp. D2-41]MDG3009241.1 sigma-70 family RNA polymerase sigma factor [Rhodococcus sp. D2-41]MDG3016085.1 sigma-70 family RNA polymerase sigma factor [Corynebacteriales bacterium D3-21]